MSLFFPYSAVPFYPQISFLSIMFLLCLASMYLLCHLSSPLPIFLVPRIPIMQFRPCVSPSVICTHVCSPQPQTCLSADMLITFGVGFLCAFYSGQKWSFKLTGWGRESGVLLRALLYWVDCISIFFTLTNKLTKNVTK